MSSPPPQRAAIALGANLGDCQATLEEALAALDASPGVRVIARSRWYRSAPVGPPQPDYVNGCALLAVALEPDALLERLLATEHRFGRVRGERWGPRRLDLDLLLVGAQRLVTPRLTLPHPRLRERAFVLVPLAEIAPAWIDPVSGQSVAELAAALPAALRGEDTLAALEP
ncbi:MAG: 2-amino-4-hydroxy-6-hydroxymethyldihydropteridine diphosphokinase [Synechococcaceae cyanobacterium]|nr:2-amino-4-hydroxy-6-hydroxymethyldihydropteridine diphosphokinase [Synechococcaceae cyanobacterium]